MIMEATTSTQVFHLFPKLTPELRTMIWEATFEPRIVALDYTKKHGFCTDETPPVALQVNHEACEIALKHYSLCFGNIFDTRVTYFNFILDTLYLQEDFHDYTQSLIMSLGPEEVKSLERIAIHAEIRDGAGPNPPFEVWDILHGALKRLPSLNSVTLVEYLFEDECNPEAGHNPPPKRQFIYDQFPANFAHLCEEIPTVCTHEVNRIASCCHLIKYGPCETCFEKYRVE
jgi:hypothetical protein